MSADESASAVCKQAVPINPLFTSHMHTTRPFTLIYI